MNDATKISLDIDFAALTGSGLVTTFNNLAAMAALYGIPAKPVKRFADSAVGRQRCERLRLEIRDASAKQGVEIVPEQLRQDTLAIQQAAMEEARPNQPEEESDMAAAKKGARKAAPKTKTDKAPAKARGFADDAVITVKAKENPRRGAAAERFNLYKDGMTVAQYSKKFEGGRSEALVHLRWDVKHGHITVK